MDYSVTPKLLGMDEMRSSNEMMRFSLHEFTPWIDATRENARNIIKRHCMIGGVVMKMQWFSASPVGGRWIRFDD